MEHEWKSLPLIIERLSQLLCQGQPLTFGGFPRALRERNNKIVGKMGRVNMWLLAGWFGVRVLFLDAVV